MFKKCVFPAIPVFILILTVIFDFTKGFVLGDKKIIHENNGTVEDFTVDFDITDDDYEMNSEVEDNVKLFGENKKELNRLNGTEAINNPTNEKVKRTQTTETTHNTSGDFVNPKYKREVSVETEHNLAARTTEKNGNYRKYGSRFKIVNFFKMLKYSNDTGMNSRFDIKSLVCLIAECTENPEYKVLALPIWNIVLIWFLVYFILAIPLWCTRGWCSCCLFCKFFKPQETIREAKKYILLNPPGILVTKRGGIIHYEPTAREKDCYERFVHFVRTL